jgi:DNA-binding beta-propeller fold protein YncE
MVFIIPANAEGPWVWAVTLQQTGGRGVMNSPTSLYIDKELERYYVVDAVANRLLSYSREGDFINAFTAGNQLETPFDLIRKPGFLWVVEKGKNSLTGIDLEKRKISPKTISDQGSTVYPDRLEIDKDTLYLLNKAKGNILALDKDLKILQRYECNDCNSGFVDFVIKGNRILALEQQEKAVYVFSKNGSQESKIELPPHTVDFPRSIAVDDGGGIYILERHKGAIAVFDNKGQFKYSFLQEGQVRGQLYYPIEIKFDPWGRLCVVDEGNGRVQIFVRK